LNRYVDGPHRGRGPVTLDYPRRSVDAVGVDRREGRQGIEGVVVVRVAGLIGAEHPPVLLGRGGYSDHVHSVQIIASTVPA